MHGIEGGGDREGDHCSSYSLSCGSDRRLKKPTKRHAISVSNVMSDDVLTKYTVSNGWRFPVVNSEYQVLFAYTVQTLLLYVKRKNSGRYS
jgi:hypothetical protein